MRKNNLCLIKELRNRTGIGIIECKKALFYTKNNLEQAIDYLRSAGVIKAEKKTINSTLEGLILIYQKNNNIAILELNCETDFVSKNIDFINFGKKILDRIVCKNITDISDINIFFEKHRVDLISKFNENINIRRIKLVQKKCSSYYLHRFRIGVIVSFDNMNSSINKEIMKNISMHIAASKPKYIDASNIPQEVIQREYNIQLELTKKLNKNKLQEENIIKGKMNKFINEITLLNQIFIMNTKKTVKKILKENNLKVLSFIRFELGEKI
ncbi:translation elongation factor Ts [Buchnera aphidicola (Kurisakia onigurumii)]|uniref:translation elongation factor Ts n=1 Tax=Buchnera aphidicola TaxID=9 RepID=UPI0031B6F137